MNGNSTQNILYMNSQYNSQMLGANCNYYSTNPNYNFQNNIFAQNTSENFFPETKNVFFQKNKMNMDSYLFNKNCQSYYPRSNPRNCSKYFNETFKENYEQNLNNEQKEKMLNFPENEHKNKNKFSKISKYSKKSRGIPKPPKKKFSGEESEFQKVSCKRKISFNSHNSSGSCDKNNRKNSSQNSQNSASTRTSSFEKEEILENPEKKNETEVKNNHQINPTLENTEILRVNVKISKDNYAVFKLKRYDDVFYTIKLFCEINGVKEELLKPLIVKSLCALNTIYQVMNSKISNDDVNLLRKIKNNDFASD